MSAELLREAARAIRDDAPALDGDRAWHPAVALAVADLLDDLAMGVDLGLLNYAAEQTALVAARAYLGAT